MTQRMSRERLVRRLAEAEGYLELEMPEKSLQILMGRPDWGTLQFEANLLTGEAYRIQGHYRDAIKPLEKAAALRPGDINAAVALGWCYKRTHCLAQAIDALERAERAHPDEPLLHYNLACYWCLAGGFDRSLTELNLALDLDPDLRERIAAEADFDRLRGHPEFDRLLLGRAPLV
ncbi:MAG: tetratricopeptide repeat protein [Isosphaeraceae bacterium]